MLRSQEAKLDATISRGQGCDVNSNSCSNLNPCASFYGSRREIGRVASLNPVDSECR